jgi:predicted O-methyltransferase YrrM
MLKSHPNMPEIATFFANLYNCQTSIDEAHNALLFGIILSLKPKKVLELGIGMGHVTRTILMGFRYNGLGEIISVDSCKDFDGKEPPHFEDLKKMGVHIEIDLEQNFIEKQKSESFDLLISDADHKNGAAWIEKTVDILKKPGFMFFHDVNLPGLLGIKNYLTSINLPFFVFDQSTRPKERCERGWLMSFKN